LALASKRQMVDNKYPSVARDAGRMDKKEPPFLKDPAAARCSALMQAGIFFATYNGS